MTTGIICFIAGFITAWGISAWGISALCNAGRGNWDE